jgi:DHA1 family bicyclomycin/chloramphenicol resistance-like MFS transporter
MAFSRPGKLPLILGGLTALGPLSIDMYLPSFQAIARDLAASPARVQLTLAVFFIALGIGQAFYGPISDRFGRRRPLCIGLSVYVLASAGCALARSVDGLIACRFVQALGGCAGMVIARAVVRDRFDEREAARFFSLLMLVTGLAPILAPSIGGQIVVFLSWRAIFWILAGFGVYGLTTVLLLLPESLPPERRAQGGVGEALYVYASLLRDRSFMRYALSGALVISGMFAYIFGSPFVFMQIHGVRPERFGWIFGAIAFGLISASQLNRFLLARIAAPRILSSALVVTATAGSALAIVVWTGTDGLPALIAPLFVYVASLGFVLPNVIATALAPQGRRAGTASALLGTLQFGAGATVGILLGVLGNGTALPMAGLIAACGLAALIVHRATAP